MFFTKRLPRYNDYIFLGPSSASSVKHYTIRTLLLIGVLFLSVVVNCVFVVRGWKRWTSPLDDYQQLYVSYATFYSAGCSPSPRKHYTLVDRTLIQPPLPPATSPANTPSIHAVVTTLYNDAYAAAVATLGHSLRTVNTTASLVLLYFPDKVSPKALCLATSSGFVPYPATRIPPPDNGAGMNPHFADQYTKLNLWAIQRTLPDLQAVVYLDSDTLVRRNFDELFRLPYAFAATPDVYLDARGFTTSFNAGVLLIRPDVALHAQLLAAVPRARYPREMAEQAFLNQFFATDVLRLPYAYNGNIALKARAPAVWDGIKDEMRVVHYTIYKPFISHSWKEVSVDHLEERVEAAAREYGGLFRDEMMWWGDAWKETKVRYKPEYEACMARHR